MMGDRAPGDGAVGAEGARQKPKGYENWLVLLFAMSGVIVFYERATLSYLFPAIVPEMGLQMWQVGVTTSALSLTYGFSGWIMASASDRRGRKSVLVPMIFAYSVLSWVTGAANSFVQLVAARIVVGITIGPIFPISMALLVEESTPSRRGINGGAMAALGTAAGFAVAPVVAVQLASTLGWRWAYYIVGVPGLIVALLLWRFLRESPSHSREGTARGAGNAESFRDRYVSVLRFRNVRLAAIYITWAIGFMSVLPTFTPLYLTMGQGLSLAWTGTAMASFGIGAVVGMIVLSAVSDFVGRKPTLVVSTLVMGVAPLGLLGAGRNTILIMVALFVGGLCSGSMGALTTAVVESVPISMAAGALSLALLVGTILGSTVLPAISGALADMYGLAIPIFVSALAGLLGGIVALFFTETAPRILARRSGGDVVVGRSVGT